MTLIVEKGIPIAVPFIPPTDFPAFFQPPQIDIARRPQQQDAWCYAACAQMVIRKVMPTSQVTQCQIAASVKSGADCCKTPPLPAACIESGCKKPQITEIFVKSGINAQRRPAITFDSVVTEIKAQRLIEVVVDWRGGTSSHAVLVSGFKGSDEVYVIDPLKSPQYMGWHTHSTLMTGFGNGNWSDTWTGLE